jgi:hypothetical protein
MSVQQVFRRRRALGPLVVTALVMSAAAGLVSPHVLWAAHSAAPAPAVDRPLPDITRLQRAVRAKLQPDEALLRQYTYRERRRDVKVSRLGKLYLGPWREFEVYPSTEPGETYKRLVAVDGKPLPPAELARRDAEHRKRLLDRAAQRAAETPEERRKRLEKRARELEEERHAVDDVFRVYEMAVVRREVRDGRPTLLVSLTPRPGTPTRSKAGKYLDHMHGYVWVDEADNEVVRVEMTVTKDVTLGLGLLARLDAGSTLTFRRVRVNDEIWLPAEATVRSAGRTLVFRKFALETTTYYSDYRKFSVATAEEITG